MGSLAIVLKRLLVLIALTAAGGVAYGWWRDRRLVPTSGDLPEWPPLHVVGSEPAGPPPAADPVDPTRDQAWPSSSADPGSGGDWVPGTGATDAPAGYPIKVKASSGIFHVPGGRMYERTIADRYYSDEAAAEAAGYRRSKT